MPKTKKRATARKNSTKRGKASVRPARKKTSTRATAQDPKSKVRRVAKRPTKRTAEKLAPVETKPIVADAIIETTVVTATEKPTGGIVIVEEHASAPATPSASSEGVDNVPALRSDISSDLADSGSDLGELPEQKVA